MSWFCRRILPLLALGAMLGGCNFLTPDSGSDSLSAGGQPAPATEGQDADGHAFSLADYRGKVVMLSFWAEY
jgi:hypothetical protein